MKTKIFFMVIILVVSMAAQSKDQITVDTTFTKKQLIEKYQLIQNKMKDLKLARLQKLMASDPDCNKYDAIFLQMDGMINELQDKKQLTKIEKK